MTEIEQMRAINDARVAELLEANNREVERRRAAEATVANLRAMLRWIELEGVPQPAPDEDQITALAGRIVDSLLSIGQDASPGRGRDGHIPNESGDCPPWCPACQRRRIAERAADPVEQDRAEWDKEKRW